MAYKYNGTTLRVGRSWTDADGVTHPSNWGTWSEEDKKEKGIVWEDDAPLFDSRFYWSHDLPKALEDVADVDLDGQPVLDDKGEQVITKGLKSNAIAQVKTTAGALLSETAWMIERFNDPSSGKAVPQEVLDQRQAIREASNDIEDAILGVTTLEDFKALYETPVDSEGTPTGNAPINDWPEPLE